MKRHLVIDYNLQAAGLNTKYFKSQWIIDDEIVAGPGWYDNKRAWQIAKEYVNGRRHPHYPVPAIIPF